MLHLSHSIVHFRQSFPLINKNNRSTEIAAPNASKIEELNGSYSAEV